MRATITKSVAYAKQREQLASRLRTSIQPIARKLAEMEITYHACPHRSQGGVAQA